MFRNVPKEFGIYFQEVSVDLGYKMTFSLETPSPEAETFNAIIVEMPRSWFRDYDKLIDIGHIIAQEIVTRNSERRMRSVRIQTAMDN